MSELLSTISVDTENNADNVGKERLSLNCRLLDLIERLQEENVKLRGSEIMSTVGGPYEVTRFAPSYAGYDEAREGQAVIDSAPRAAEQEAEQEAHGLLRAEISSLLISNKQLSAENERLHVWIVDLRAAVQYLTKENEALRNAVHSEVSAPPFPLGRAIQRTGLPTP